MTLLISYLLVVSASLLAIPVCVFLLEIIAGTFLPSKDFSFGSRKGFPQRVAVLVPAHNERAGLGLTLANIKTQLLAGDRLLVVADNCSDDTAAVALAAGAEVIARNDLTRSGKGYALDFGLQHLSLDPPAVVIVIDADCKLAEGAIDRLTTTCAATCRPAQALYLMSAPDGSPIKYQVAEFAWRVKNWVRPLGLRALGLPCQLAGTGMAFPWELIRSANLASGSIIEDLKLGLDLAQSGKAPVFCPSARVISHFPWTAEGAKTQRKRWEEGHVRMIITAFPGLLFNAVLSGNCGLIALALDLMVPPLSLLVVLVSAMFFTAAVAAAFGISSALIVSAASLVALVVAVLLSWLRYGLDVLPPSKAFSVATYVFSKFPLYRQLLSGNATPIWVRTDRNDTRIPSVQPIAEAPALETPPQV